MQPGPQVVSPRPPARPAPGAAPSEAEIEKRKFENMPAWMKHGVGVGKRKYGLADASEAEATGFFKPGQQSSDKSQDSAAKVAKVDGGSCSRIHVSGLKTPDGEELHAFMLKGKGVHVEVISWGIYITKIL